MTVPLCVQCVKQPVKKAYGKHRPKRGYRIVDGVRWQWFCCQKCAGADAGFRQGISATFRNQGKRNRVMAEQRLVARLAQACKDVMDAQQRVPAKDMVRVLMAETRKAYARGFSAAYKREQRAAA